MAIKFFAFFFPTISTFGCFWSQWPTSLAVTSSCPTMRCGRLPSRSDVNNFKSIYPRFGGKIILVHWFVPPKTWTFPLKFIGNHRNTANAQAWMGRSSGSHTWLRMVGLGCGFLEVEILQFVAWGNLLAMEIYGKWMKMDENGPFIDWFCYYLRKIVMLQFANYEIARGKFPWKDVFF